MRPRELIYRGETRVLNSAARNAAPGKFVELSEGRVHYELGGPTAEKTVILVPGFSVPYPIWDPTYKALVAAGNCVLRYDLYGRGYSDRPDIHYDQDLFDRQLFDLIDTLGINGLIDLVGISLGGAISVVFAHRHPELVSKLCLIDPAGLPWKQSIVARLAMAPMVGELIMCLLGNKVLFTKLADHFFGDQTYQELKEIFLVQMQFVGFKRALLSTLRSGVTTGAAQAYAGVGKQEHPVMLIWGEKDQQVPLEVSESVLRLIPRAQFHVINGVGHIPHYECPEIVNPLLIDFLTG